MEQFAEYGHALASIAFFTILTLLLSPVSAIKKTSTGLAPGATPANDYTDPAYRWHRAYGNAAETMGTFAGVTIAAILAGASPFWVNTLASVFLVSRVLMLIVHLGAIGSPNNGPRSIMYVIGWACCIALAILTLISVF